MEDEPWWNVGLLRQRVSIFPIRKNTKKNAKKKSKSNCGVMGDIPNLFIRLLSFAQPPCLSYLG